MSRAVALTVVASIFGWWLKDRYGASLLEFFGFVTGILGVYLVSQESVWNWPVGIVNVSIYAVFFFTGGFPADAGLQIFFLVLSILGWYSWVRGGEGQSNLEVTRLVKSRWSVIAIAWVFGTACLYPVAMRLEGKWPFWDSFLTTGSVLAQVLVNRKKIENWLLWIAVNSIYVPIFILRGWYLSAILYGVFWCLAINGWRNWSSSLAKSACARF